MDMCRRFSLSLIYMNYTCLQLRDALHTQYRSSNKAKNITRRRQREALERGCAPSDIRAREEMATKKPATASTSVSTAEEAATTGYLSRLANAAKQMAADNRPGELLTNNAAAARLPNEVFFNTAAARNLREAYPGGAKMNAMSRCSSEGITNRFGQYPGSLFFNGAMHRPGESVVNTMGGRPDKVAANATGFSHFTNSGVGGSQSHTSHVPRLQEVLQATRMLGQRTQGAIRPGPPLRQEFETALMERPVPWSHLMPVVGISGYPPQRIQLFCSGNANFNANANQSAHAKSPAVKNHPAR